MLNDPISARLMIERADAPAKADADPTSLHENIAALSAELHTSADYDAFYKAIGPQVDGFPGIFRLAVDMARALSAWEEESGGAAEAYENAGLGWIETVEAYAARMIRDSLQFETLADPAKVLAEVIREAMGEEPQPFMAYVEAVDAAMKRLWGIDTTDAGIEMDRLAAAQEAGETPEAYAQWFGEKHGLTPQSDWTQANAERVMSRFKSE